MCEVCGAPSNPAPVAAVAAGVARVYVPSTDPAAYQDIKPDERDALPEDTDMTEVIPGLWLGNQRAAGIDPTGSAAPRLAELKRRGITHVVCACGEGPLWTPFRSDGLHYLNMSLLDGDSDSPLEATFPLFGSILPQVRL